MTAFRQAVPVVRSTPDRRRPRVGAKAAVFIALLVMATAPGAAWAQAVLDTAHSPAIAWPEDSRLQPSAALAVGFGFKPIVVQEAPRRSSSFSEVFVLATAGSALGLLGGAWVGANAFDGVHSGSNWGSVFVSSLVGGTVGAAAFGAMASKGPFGHGVGGAVIGTFLGFPMAYLGGTVADLPGVVVGMVLGQALGAAGALGESREDSP